MILKRKNKVLIIGCSVLLVLSSLLMAGCKNQTARYSLYYLNKDKNQIVLKDYQPTATDTDDLVVEFLDKISENTTNINMQKPFPDDVCIEGYRLENRILNLYFNDKYEDMPDYEEVMCRGAIVLELMQIDGVDGVTFFVDDHQIKDANGMTIGMMNNDSFVGNPTLESKEKTDGEEDENQNIEVID